MRCDRASCPKGTQEPRGLPHASTCCSLARRAALNLLAPRYSSPKGSSLPSAFPANATSTHRCSSLSSFFVVWVLAQTISPKIHDRSSILVLPAELVGSVSGRSHSESRYGPLRMANQPVDEVMVQLHFASDPCFESRFERV